MLIPIIPTVLTEVKRNIHEIAYLVKYNIYDTDTYRIVDVVDAKTVKDKYMNGKFDIYEYSRMLSDWVRYKYDNGGFSLPNNTHVLEHRERTYFMQEGSVYMYYDTDLLPVIFDNTTFLLKRRVLSAVTTFSMCSSDMSLKTLRRTLLLKGGIDCDVPFMEVGHLDYSRPDFFRISSDLHKTLVSVSVTVIENAEIVLLYSCTLSKILEHPMMVQYNNRVYEIIEHNRRDSYLSQPNVLRTDENGMVIADYIGVTKYESMLDLFLADTHNKTLKSTETKLCLGRKYANLEIKMKDENAYFALNDLRHT